MINTSAAFVAWGLPIIIMVFGWFLGNWATAVSWPIALAWLGGASLLNAKRCGRTHCIAAGPFYLALAVIALMFSFGLVETTPRTWAILGGITALGAVGIGVGTEALFGKYLARR